jgi:hypothetical protein
MTPSNDRSSLRDHAKRGDNGHGRRRLLLRNTLGANAVAVESSAPRRAAASDYRRRDCYDACHDLG